MKDSIFFKNFLVTLLIENVMAISLFFKRITMSIMAMRRYPKENMVIKVWKLIMPKANATMMIN